MADASVAATTVSPVADPLPPFVAASTEESVEHASAVAELAVAVAAELGMDNAARHEVRLAGLFHDVGKAELPEDLLVKPAALDADERRLIERHTILGEELLERADPSLRGIGRIVRSCHERWDGHGYPDGLSGNEIPLAARIVFCCDSYHAMVTDRPYRRALGERRARRELRACAGTQFDPRVAGALLRVLDGRGRATRGDVPSRAARSRPARLAFAPATFG